MGVLLALAVALWLLGAVMKVSRGARWAMIGALYLAVLGVQVLMPEGHALRTAIGGTPQGWFALGLVAALVVAYRLALGALRRRAAPPAQAGTPKGPLSPTELDRYARHIVLREVGGPGQRKLKEAKVLVVGAGGLGSPALLYLGAAGVGTLGVVDDDIVSASNLQRQVIHTDARIGMPKVFSAQAALSAQNPFVEVRPYHRRLDAETAEALFAEYDLVLDGSDNFDTRDMVNRAAVRTATPLVAGAIAQWEGQVSLYDPAHGTPCYACIFPQAPAPGLAPSCAEAGVIGALPGIIGSMMAMEAIKHITGAGQTLAGRMAVHDALYSESRVIALKRRADCPVCGGTGKAA
ncbi:HesA/MoeB/ThiF family protein [Rhodovulum adriaticum]|uniref:Molybdopterin-synthase adenylyltransferase n=1 Tax=Rhodovulum adriaticum TaxID=35804 RepID=A0A4R2NWQ3_RHOAD|nr:molybdopterin-synthase adenylyltransferase MoeB [Rhodovulum adriaticum]MBK1636226.1 molybdopterin biosynthesis protein [Rhodovulum adriaticum]TCP26520.1 molybdopterin/thiamine biosynthesis adenylyltransferase [Rhodovulum adriaticum]